jgi:hypothetical protein
VWWYKTVYQVLSVAWTNRITTVVILVHITNSTWNKVLYHHTMYVMGIYCEISIDLEMFLFSQQYCRRKVSRNFSKLTFCWLLSHFEYHQPPHYGCDAVSSRNRQDLIHSLVPPHYAVLYHHTMYVYGQRRH